MNHEDREEHEGRDLGISKKRCLIPEPQPKYLKNSYGLMAEESCQENKKSTVSIADWRI